MKKMVSLIMAGLLTAAMVVSAAAAGENEILKGTPVMDGVLDEMYTYSTSCELDNFAFWTDGTASVETDSQGTTAYMLWDDDYLYIATVVNDSTSSGDIQSDIDYTKWNVADNVEHYLYASDLATGGQIHVGAIGEGLVVKEEGITCAAADVEVAASYTGSGYVVELALPILAATAELKAGSEIAYCLQYNDYIPADPSTIACGRQHIEDLKLYVLSAEEAPAPVVEPEPEVVDEVVDNTAPQTFDAGVIAAVAAIVSAAGYAISKKR